MELKSAIWNMELSLSLNGYSDVSSSIDKEFDRNNLKIQLRKKVFTLIWLFGCSINVTVCLKYKNQMSSLGRLSHRFFLFVCVQLNLSVYLSVRLGSCLIQFFPGSLSVGLSICFCFLVCLSDCMFGCLTVCLSLLSLSVYLSSLFSFKFLKFLCI